MLTYTLDKNSFCVVEATLGERKSITVIPKNDTARDIINLLKQESAWGIIISKVREKAREKFNGLEIKHGLVEFVCEEVAKQINERIKIYGI